MVKFKIFECIPYITSRDTGAYAKAGYIQATLITAENLATGSKYEDVDMTGMQIGGGYEGELGDMAFGELKVLNKCGKI